MEYNKMSSPVVFNQSISTDKGTTFKNNTYLYNQELQPNAPVQIGDMHYTYDAAGNPTSILDTNGIGRDMIWDAENRLKEIIDTKEGLFHSYAYDHTGERILKRYGTAQNAYYNGKDMSTLHDFGDSYSAYASAYFVENNNGYTKHYYAGATRLVSKIGEDYYENNELVPTGKEEKKQYFYFQDHLGSNTYITDLNGDIAQYSAYTPYGEMFREYRNITPYRFNGKELDTETGLYYYGARYYNPSTALWLGVDPLASKYPGVSPYVYCVGNPVKYVDPDGRVVGIAKINASIGGGVGFAISGRIECGIAFDEYGSTFFMTSTPNYVSNQNIEENSKNAQLFIGGYAGVTAGIEVDWKSHSFEEWTKSFSTSIPLGCAELSVGDNSIGIGLGFGVGFSFETSPASCIKSLSMSYEEYNVINMMNPLGCSIEFDRAKDFIKDESKNIIGYKAIANIYTSNGTVNIPVQCGITDIKTGEPTYLWETDLYRQNKLNE